MRGIMVLGIVMLVLGGVLMAVGAIKYQDTDPVIDIGSVEITKTETRKKRIPVAVSGTIMGVGAALVLVGAAKKKG